ncbi:hypothetical protein J7K99_07120 [bacterium]|nr:hypothetical protein [bacterium]
MLNLEKTTIDKICTLLKQIKELMMADNVLISDYQGRLICGVGDMRRSKAVLMTSLAAGGFLAMAQLGEFVGEKNFPKILVRNGVKLNIAICPVEKKAFVVFAYPKQVEIKPLAAQIIAVLKKVNTVIDSQDESEVRKYKSLSTEEVPQKEEPDIIPPTEQTVIKEELPKSKDDLLRVLEEMFGEQVEE